LFQKSKKERCSSKRLDAQEFLIIVECSKRNKAQKTDFGATAEYPATIVLDSTCAHIFKEQEMRMNELGHVAGYSTVKHRLSTVVK